MNTLYFRFFKRPLDLIFSFFALILLLPVILVVALLVKIKLGSPVIFKQHRPGLNENIFHLYKFRTMTNKKDEDGNLLKDELRLTNFGKLLRSTSFDELPSLFNVIKGDMSLVGPRPLLVEYLKYYNEAQKNRHKVRPGLTGYAQVSGRNLLSWDKRFQLDLIYINKITFNNDFAIIIKTLIKVLKKEGINSNNSVTMENFKGTQPKS
jgi:lipopolysaccharide/colanic/teichoic acid biosynthesis glycosyltransferase